MTDPVKVPPPPAPLAIRRARLLAGLSQAQAAALIYKTARMWINYEQGRSPMDYLIWEIFQTRAARVQRRQYPRGNREPPGPR